MGCNGDYQLDPEENQQFSIELIEINKDDLGQFERLGIKHVSKVIVPN